MKDRPNVECQKCHWQGDASELECSPEEAESDEPTLNDAYNRCPACGSYDIEYTYDDDDLNQLFPPPL